MLSQPLTKAIQTTEGVLIVVADVAVGVTSTLDPSALPHKYAAVIVAAQNVALLAQRGILKGVALSTGLGVVPQPKPALSASHEAQIVEAGQSLVETVTKLVQKPESAAAPDGDPSPAAAPVVAETPAPAPVVAPPAA